MFDIYQVADSQQALCPQLYQNLRRVFGEVRFANKGESMLTTTPYNPATGTYTTWISYSGEYYRVCCPFCQDTRYRLWVNHMYGQPDCGGRPMRFLATCYNDDCLADHQNWKRFNDAVIGFRNYQQTGETFEVLPGERVSLHTGPAPPPGNVIPITQLQPTHHAYAYMVGERRYTHHMLDRYRIGYCSDASREYPAAHNRIVFPVLMHGYMAGWQCRYVGNANWKMTPKYYGMPGMRKRAMLYNYDFAKNKSYVIVVEGPTDANAVGDAAVGLMGKHLSLFQIQLLTQTWERKPIVLMLDADAREESQAAIRDLRNLQSNPVVSVDLPDGYDPSDYGHEVIWNIIRARCRERGVELR